MATKAKRRWQWAAGITVFAVAVTSAVFVVTRDSGSVVSAADNVVPVSIAGLDAKTMTFRGETIAVDGEKTLSLDVEHAAPAILTVESQDGTEYEAIVMSFEGYTSEEVQVDEHSTAFARLISAPPLLTADPLVVIGVRMLVDDLDSFDQMAAAIDEGEEELAADAHAAVVADIANLLDEEGHLGPESAELRRGFGFSVSGTRGNSLQCPTDEPTGEYGLCITSDDNELTLVNRARHWRAVVETSPGDESSVIAALVPPRYHGLSGGLLDFLVTGVHSLVTDGVDWIADQANNHVQNVCDTSLGGKFFDAVAWLGGPDACTTGLEEQVEFISGGLLAITTGGRVDDFALDPEGVAVTRVSAQSQVDQATLVTWAWGADIGDVHNDRGTATAAGIVVALDITNTIVEPIASLVSGISARSAQSQLSFELGQGDLLAFSSVLSDAEIMNLTAQLTSAGAAKDLELFMGTAHELSAALVANKEVWGAIQSIAQGQLVSIADHHLDQVVNRLGRKTGLEVVSKIFAPVDVVDRGFQGAGAVIQFHGFAVEFNLLSARVQMPPLHSYAQSAPGAEADPPRGDEPAPERKQAPDANPGDSMQTWRAYLETATVTNPRELSWPSDTHPAIFIPIPFWPDGDYQGEAELPDPEIGNDASVYGAAPPFFAGISNIDLARDGVQEVGPTGSSVQVHQLDGGLMPYQSAGGDLGAWLVVAVESDMYSDTMRWALCIFHLSPDSPEYADEVFCSQGDDPFSPEALMLHSWALAPDGTLFGVTGIQNSDTIWGMRYDVGAEPYEMWGEYSQGVLRMESAGASSGEFSDLDPHALRALQSPIVTWGLP